MGVVEPNTSFVCMYTTQKLGVTFVCRLTFNIILFTSSSVSGLLLMWTQFYCIDKAIILLLWRKKLIHCELICNSSTKILSHSFTMIFYTLSNLLGSAFFMYNDSYSRRTLLEIYAFSRKNIHNPIWNVIDWSKRNDGIYRSYKS